MTYHLVKAEIVLAVPEEDYETAEQMAMAWLNDTEGIESWRLIKVIPMEEE